jgi:hypothetical protein
MTIPTTSKTKMPQGWSYPVGAEAISDSLQGILQFEFISLRFLWSNPTSHWARQHDQSTMGLVTASYRPPSGPYPLNWEIDVHGIPTEMKAKLKDEIITEVLPKVRSWMTAQRTAVWQSKSHYWTAQFDSNPEMIIYGEN